MVTLFDEKLKEIMMKLVIEINFLLEGRVNERLEISWM